MTQTRLDKLDLALPQTQCRQCGFDGCRAYATAMDQGLAPINRCAPGGKKGIIKLAKILDTEILDLDPEYGHEVPLAFARIRAKECIGCSWCIPVCPTGAIVGAPKHLHAVLEDRCTGCALCLPACPMDAFRWVEPGREWTEEDARKAKANYEFMLQHREKREKRRNALLESRRAPQRKNLIASLMAQVQKKNG